MARRLAISMVTNWSGLVPVVGVYRIRDGVFTMVRPFLRCGRIRLCIGVHAGVLWLVVDTWTVGCVLVCPDRRI